VSEGYLLGSAWDCHCGAEGARKCPACVCKELERERDDALTLLAHIQEQRVYAANLAGSLAEDSKECSEINAKVCRERDEARAVARRLYAPYDGGGKHWDALRDEYPWLKGDDAI